MAHRDPSDPGARLMIELWLGAEQAVAPSRPCTSGERTRTRLQGMGHQRRVRLAHGAHGRGLPVTAALRSFARYKTHAWFRVTSQGDLQRWWCDSDPCLVGRFLVSVLSKRVALVGALDHSLAR